MYYISQKNNSNIYLFIFFDKIYYLLLYSNITYNIHWFYFNPHPNNWRLFIGGTTILNSFKLKKKKSLSLPLVCICQFLLQLIFFVKRNQNPKVVAVSVLYPGNLSLPCSPCTSFYRGAKWLQHSWEYIYQ